MMDLKEIIKWFIPCFHILRLKKRKMDAVLTFLCLFLFFNSCAGLAAKINSASGVEVNENNLVSTKNLDDSLDYEGSAFHNQSEHFSVKNVEKDMRSLDDTIIGRTFGRPMMKKMMAAIIPLAFQIGAASTWAVVAALVGVKTLVVTLIILKVLLIAGAAKIGALFGGKHHQSHGWEQQTHGWETPHQKEIHLHIHNDKQAHLEHQEYSHSPWSREGQIAAVQDTKNVNVIYDPYRGGPQTISTPFGNYVKIDEPAKAPSF